jgi:hypothetical protein
MAKNALFVIQPYLWNGLWVFDDPDAGLVKEPFVSGVPEIIERATAKITNPENGFIAIFSANPFPGFDIHLELLREEFGGNWYSWSETGQEGWLCPALFKYFETAPRNIYVKVEPLKKK